MSLCVLLTLLTAMPCFRSRPWARAAASPAPGWRWSTPACCRPAAAAWPSSSSDADRYTHYLCFILKITIIINYLFMKSMFLFKAVPHTLSLLTVLLDVLQPGHTGRVHGPGMPQLPNLGPDKADGVKLEDGVISHSSLIVIPPCNTQEEEDGNKLKKPVAMTALLMDTVLKPYILRGSGPASVQAAAPCTSSSVEAVRVFWPPATRYTWTQDKLQRIQSTSDVFILILPSCCPY